jgi:hypothetical protein
MDSYYTKYYSEEEFEKMREGIVCKVVVLALGVMFVGTIVTAVNGQYGANQKQVSGIDFIQRLVETRNQFSKDTNSTQACEEVYDLLIIAPMKFSKVLESLVAHKNRFNILTILKTTEEIYD